MFDMFKGMLNTPVNPAAPDFDRREAERNGMKDIFGQFGEFFKLLKNPKPQARRDGFQLPSFLPAVFDFFSFAGAESMRRFQNPEQDPAKEAQMQQIFESQKGFKMVSFAIDFFKGVFSFIGQKAMGKISPFLDAITGMIGLRSKQAMKQEVDSGRIDKDLLNKHEQGQKAFAPVAQEMTRKGLSMLHQFTGANSRPRPQGVTDKKRDRLSLPSRTNSRRP